MKGGKLGRYCEEVNDKSEGRKLNDTKDKKDAVLRGVGGFKLSRRNLKASP